MNTRLYYTILVLFFLFALAVPAIGCNMAGSANGNGEKQADEASRQESDAAEPESDAEEGEEGEDDKDKEDEKKEHAVPVEVTELVLGPIESVLKSSANLEAEREVKVFSEAARLVQELLVEEGDRVRQGQVLVRLQDEEQRNSLAKVRNELAQAEREYKRQQRLFSEDLISEEEFNNATFGLEQLRISLSDAERELGYTEVKAPIRGIITQRMVNLGDQVNVGQHLFDIVDFDSLVARIYVPEQHLGELKRGQTARISARVSGGRDYTGKVNRIAPVVDPRSGTVKVTVDVGGQPGLRPGMYVDVDLVLATHNAALLVPKRAVVYDDDQMFVFRLAEERRVERIFIQPRLTDRTNIEPLDGLSEGDMLVVAGQAALKDGALVKLPGDEDEEEDEAAGEEEVVERASL